MTKKGKKATGGGKFKMVAVKRKKGAPRDGPTAEIVDPDTGEVHKLPQSTVDMLRSQGKDDRAICKEVNQTRKAHGI